jgi:hypothetical protein
MTYCLRAMGLLEECGKRGGAVLHRRSAELHRTESR